MTIPKFRPKPIPRLFLEYQIFRNRNRDFGGGGHDGGGGGHGDGHGGHGDGGGDEDWMIGVERIRNCIILLLLTNVEMVMITITMMRRIANCENL